MAKNHLSWQRPLCCNFRHMNTIRFEFLIFCCLCLTSCAALGTSNSTVKPSIEVITSEEQALEEVMKMPKQFVVKYSESHHAAERVQLFLTTYTGGAQVEDNQGASQATVFSNVKSAKDKFAYQIERTTAPDGFQYIVICEPVSSGANWNSVVSNSVDVETADKNARNVARFIRDGQLEVSLLVR